MSKSSQIRPASIHRAHLGETPQGTPVEIFTLTTVHGMEARIATYGGIVTYLSAPDRNGRFADVVLGYDKLASYVADTAYLGALIGRYGNRIAHGRFRLGGVKCRLKANDGPNALHGGPGGFHKVPWTVTSAEVTAAGPRLALAYVSKDGEEGYPGNLHVAAAYTLMEDNALRLDYRAVTDRDTVLNLTQHSYFNLRGKGDIREHYLQINADRFTPVDATLIPTGELREVTDTPFDFRSPTPIGARLDEDSEQLRFGKGYDHNWVIAKSAAGCALQASVYEPQTGRVLEVLSTEPGLQFYSGNFLDGSISGKGGWRYGRHHGFCLEPQHFPDSPNQAHFPSVVLKPGQTFESTIVYRFSAR